MKKINITLVIVLVIVIASTLIFFNKKEAVIIPEPVDTFSTSTYKYINFFDWPPQTEVLDREYSCPQTSTTTEVVINNNKYCKSVISEGAAGSTYNTYTYNFAKESSTASLTFSTRQPQCMNYDNPKQTECLNEIQNINIDEIVDKSINNLKF